ncbi:hypothetical protein LMG29542_08152 [Paraburkholderia humisilvae]|uniref:DDE domain-containing protein n=1 Tax=Paraburkholderia humisilvae TaxID=627669 RepID=A0A6J5F7A3_9BURK|nr:hypothetical protein LMG29542_08152 [Paraburkholderia humisilvae]
MAVCLRGEPHWLWRAVDEHGTELDVLLQKCRDKAVAKRFFKLVLRSAPVPRRIVTDQLRSYPAAKADIPELVAVKHVFVTGRRATEQPGGEQPPADAHASARCGTFARRGVRRHFFPVSVQSGCTSPCRDTGCRPVTTALRSCTVGCLAAVDSRTGRRLRFLIRIPDLIDNIDPNPST